MRNSQGGVRSRWARWVLLALFVVTGFGSASAAASGPALAANLADGAASGVRGQRAASATPAAQMTDDSWESPLGFSLEWGREWDMLASEYTGGMETVVLATEISMVQMVALMDYSGDPGLCLTDLEETARNLFAGEEITSRRNAVDEPIGFGNDAEFKVFDVATEEFGSNGTLRVYVACEELVEGESVFGVLLLSDKTTFDDGAEELAELLDEGFTLEPIEPRDPEAFSERIEPITEDVDRFFRPVLMREHWAYTSPEYISFLGAIETSCYHVDPEAGSRAEREYDLYPGAAAVHCGVDRAVYIDQAWMETYALDEYGDAALAMIIAHEVGHHIQHLTGWIYQFDPEDPDEMYAYESSADCLAGAYLRSAVARDLYTEREVEHLDELIELIADPEEGQGHGTTEQRLDALHLGYEEGVGACDVFDE